MKTAEEDTVERKTGEEVGRAFLWEFIKAYKGCPETISDEERTKMVKSLVDKKDLSIYSNY